MKSEPLQWGGPDAPDETARQLTDVQSTLTVSWLNVLQQYKSTQSVAATLEGMEGFEVAGTYLALLEREPAVQSLSRKKNKKEEYE